MPKIARFCTRQQLEDQQAALEAASALRALEVSDLSAGERLVVSKAVSVLYRYARPSDEGLWPGGYVMLSREQTVYVWDRIRELKASERPVLVRDAFVMLMVNIRPDTGELLMSRMEFAKMLGVLPRDISSVMGALERIGVVIREHTPGSRMVTYKVNANVAWNGGLDIRKVEAAKMAKPSEAAPSLKLVKGGRSKGTR